MRVHQVLPGMLLELEGRLDRSADADVRTLLLAAVDEGSGELVLDMAGVELVDATGLGLLLGVHRRAGRAARKLVLREVPPRLARQLTATRLHRILRIEPQVAKGGDSTSSVA